MNDEPLDKWAEGGVDYLPWERERDALSVGPIPYLVIEINRKIIKRTAYCHISVFKNGFIMMMMVEHREISQAVDNNILPNLCRS